MSNSKVVARYGDGGAVHSVLGGWVVRCDLCSKSARRVFLAVNYDNHANALKLAHEYAREHAASEMHAEVKRVFDSVEAPEEEAAEELLRSIFGMPDRTPQERRKSAARSAAKNQMYKEKKEREQAARVANLCAVCGKETSRKKERADERRQLPSGAFVHIRCMDEPREHR